MASPLLMLDGMTTSTSTSEAGKRGEAVACEELARLGYAILATRHRTRYGEIDIIGRDNGVTVFVEVKARRSARRGTAAEQVTFHKRRRIAAMALDYLAWTRSLDTRCRFDVVAIDRFERPGQTIRVIKDAFQV